MSTRTGIFTVGVAGVYQLTFTAKYVSSSKGRFGAWSDVYVNNTVSKSCVWLKSLGKSKEIQGVSSARGLGWVDLNFECMLHCLPNSAWADGNLTEAAVQLGKMVEPIDPTSQCNVNTLLLLLQVVSDSQREYNGNDINSSESSTHSVLVIYALNVGDRCPLRKIMIVVLVVVC